MSKIVRVKYRSFNEISNEEQILEEVCYLIEDSDNLVPKTTIETGLSYSVKDILPSDDNILLEDSCGLWLLHREDLVSMKNATEYELQDYLNRN